MVVVKPFTLCLKKYDESLKFFSLSFKDTFYPKTRYLILKSNPKGEKKDVFLDNFNWTKIKENFNLVDEWFKNNVEEEEDKEIRIQLEIKKEVEEEEEDDNIFKINNSSVDDEFESCKMLVLTKYKGYKYVHIRRYFKPNEEFIPTKFGVCFSKYAWEKLKICEKIIDKLFSDDKISVLKSGFYNIFDLQDYQCYKTQFKFI